MIKIGKHYYKNLWALIQVVIFRKPSIQMPKGWNKQIKPLNPNPMKTLSLPNFLYGDYHEEMGDK